MNCSKDFSFDAVSQRNVQIQTFCEVGPFSQDDNAAKPVILCIQGMDDMAQVILG